MSEKRICSSCNRKVEVGQRCVCKPVRSKWSRRGNRRHYDRAAWRRISAAYRAKRPWCEMEGCHRPSTEVHHRVAVQDGGSDDEANLIATCTPCHASETAREIRDRGGGEVEG